MDNILRILQHIPFIDGHVYLRIPDHTAGRAAGPHKLGAFAAGYAAFFGIQSPVLQKVGSKRGVSKSHPPETDHIGHTVFQHSGGQIGGKLPQIAVSGAYNLYFRHGGFHFPDAGAHSGYAYKRRFRQGVGTNIAGAVYVGIKIGIADGIIQKPDTVRIPQKLNQGNGFSQIGCGPA